MKKMFFTGIALVLLFTLLFVSLSVNAYAIRKDGTTQLGPGGIWDCNCRVTEVVDCHCVIEI